MTFPFSTDDTAISIRQLVKNYGKERALDHISLDIEQGEIFGLLGPNGAGKSTLIHILVGLTLKTSGTVTVLGYDIVRDYLITRK